MDEPLEDLVERLQLTEAEQEVITVPDEEIRSNVEKGRLCLIGSVFTGRPFNAEAMKNTLSRAWKPENGVNIIELRRDLFLFQFRSLADKIRVYQNGPWSFEKQLVVLAEFNGFIPISLIKLTLTKAAFWIRVYNLPLAAMSRATGELIGNKIGRFLDMDYDGDGPAWGSGLRIRVELDIFEPLRRGVKVVLGRRGPIWVQFKYERLPNFCYRCGCLDHVEEDCDGEDQQYGPWLRFEEEVRQRKGGAGGGRRSCGEETASSTAAGGENHEKIDVVRSGVLRLLESGPTKLGAHVTGSGAQKRSKRKSNRP